MYRDVVGRTGMYHVAYWEGRVCIVWHSGRTGMYRVA